MAIDDEDAARMSGGTAGGASSSYGLNEDDEEAYLYGDVEVEDADMEIEAETFPGDAGEDVVAEAVVASDDKVQPSDDNPAYQTVYFNEPLDDNGKPLLRNRRQAMNEEDGSSSSGHLKRRRTAFRTHPGKDCRQRAGASLYRRRSLLLRVPAGDPMWIKRTPLRKTWWKACRARWSAASASGCPTV